MFIKGLLWGLTGRCGVLQGAHEDVKGAGGAHKGAQGAVGARQESWGVQIVVAQSRQEIWEEG